MNSIPLLQMVVQQTWQVALLAGLVWFMTRTVGRERPHLSHMLWALVLVKCITPPIWSSPVGLFSQMGNHIGIVGNREPNANALSDFLAHASGYQTLVIASQQNFADRPYEIVVVKCSLPYAKQDAVDTSERPK